MCGIYSRFTAAEGETENPFEEPDISAIKDRGPDATNTLSFFIPEKYAVFFGFHRLSIIGEHDGAQPFVSNERYYLMCNGEIYNYKELIDEYKLKLRSRSDCEVILCLFQELRCDIDATVKKLKGEFAFVLYDRQKHTVYFGRDPFGVRPLFMHQTKRKEWEDERSELQKEPRKGRNKKVESDDDKSVEEDDDNELILASEAKVFDRHVDIKQVPPRCIWKYNILKGELSMVSQYYTLPKVVQEKQDPINVDTFKELFIQSVKRRLMVDDGSTPASKIGFFLSGGLDSSLVLSVAMRVLSQSGDISRSKIKVFTFGFEKNAPDILAAKEVVKYLKKKYGEKSLDHHVIVRDIFEGIAAIPEVVKTIESFDTTTVRASTPMYMMSSYVREETDLKIILSGEGSDELNCLGYLYLLYAPSVDDARAESVRLLENIHFFDGLRADRSVSAFGLELRVPFLDGDFVSYTMAYNDPIKQALESKTEKKFLRDAFTDYLPDAILYRQKNAFSDAVSYDWKTKIKEHADTIIKTKHQKLTSEEMWYLTLFCRDYEVGLIPYLWLPKWVDTGSEPSATVLNVFKKYP